MLDTLKESTVDQTMLDSVLTMPPTPRIRKLRNEFFSPRPAGTPSILRARIETRVLRETEGEPMITRRAKVFAAVVREMPIDIFPDELLVGFSGGNITPMNTEMLTGRRSESQGYRQGGVPGLSETDSKELYEDIIPYWKAQGRYGKHWNYGHNVHGMERVLTKGFLGIKKDAEDRLAGIDPNDPGELKKVPFLEGVVLAMEAAAEFGQRFAARARELAETQPDARRKKELLRIAEICDWVPANPARTFYEALQSYHFAWLLLIWELSRGSAFSQGRMDQYLYLYYERDVAEGRITRKEAQELLDSYIIKLNQGGDSGSIGVGGLQADGNDATNDLSFMFIESIMHTRLVNPYFAVHVHSKTPDDLLIKACELCSLGAAHPQFINSDVGVTQALARGSAGGTPIALVDARAAANVGCLELVVPGKDSGFLYVGAGHNLALALELALNNGVSRTSRQQMGPKTGDPRQFKSFEDVQEAFHKQVAWMRENTQKASIQLEQSLLELKPTVYESALIDDCIERGLSKEEGGARYDYNLADVEHGSTDAGNSLAAIQELVFQDKKFTMGQLCDALDSDFEGHEDIRKLCLGIPKFGNDDDYVDGHVAWVLNEWGTEFRRLKNLRGCNASAGGSPLAAYIPKGREVGALPSGRLSGEPLAPAACPRTGEDRKGATAVFKSMGKVDGVDIPAGLSLTTRIDPDVFRTRDGVKRMADLIRTFVDQKVFHVQFNMTSTETLREAQEKPEEYRDLMVKVAGYNAYFTQLSDELQDAIINRTEHEL